ncbi:MAG: hypothetical protein KC620_23800 [Myxococcales bacterium]|nr:hypothetical protein [Myxococcales bacterium]
MLPPLIFVWLTWRLMMPAPALENEFGPYDGPLAERQVTGIHPDHSTRFSVISDTAKLKRFERWLRKHPIYVRAPGEKYIVWGIKTWRHLPGEFMVTCINTLLEPQEQPLGPWIGDGGAMLEWAFSVLDHYDLPFDPLEQGWSKTRQGLIDSYHRDSVPVDWQAVADRLRATGRPVPADLFDRHP